MPRRPATARRCTTVFVEPPIAGWITRMAFWNGPPLRHDVPWPHPLLC